MAKGNMLLGKARGKVGSLVYSVLNGQQITRPLNDQPANPRTMKQCFQRGRFAAAVKFFTRGRQALFRFAFENKRQFESDYNAFMRENVKIAPVISKQAFDNYDYPVIAPFIMSKGSLQPMDAALSASSAVVNLGISAPETAPTTIGELSALLLSNAMIEAGDIITLVFISSAYDGTYPSTDADGTGKTSWVIRQFIVDTTSTETISAVTGMTYAASEGMATLTATAGTAPLAGTLFAFTAIHSRNTANGLKVSTQELLLSPAGVTAYDNMQADTYKQEASATWKQVGAVDMQPDTILQGSIAYGEQ